MSEQWGGGYGGYPGPGPYGPPGGYVAPSPESIAARNQAIAALVANCIATVLCCGLPSIGGLICAAISMSKADQEPRTSAKLNMWAWILFGGTFVLDILFVIAWFAFPSLFVLFALGGDTY